MSYFSVTKYNDNLYQIKDSLGVLSTLVIGEKKALLLDTCYGIGNLKEEVEKITKLPLIVVNSHGHMDHCSGNYQFDNVYINSKDVKLCREHNDVNMKQNNIERAKKLNVLPENFDIDKYLISGCGKLNEINVGTKINLGNLIINVVAMEGHTQGSIGLYIKNWKLLLVSDAACPFVWLFFDESTSVSTYIKMLERTLKLDFDNFLVGHGAKMYERSKMVDFLNVAKDIQLDKAFKTDFGENAYCYTKGVLYGPNDCGVVFDPNKM